MNRRCFSTSPILISLSPMALTEPWIRPGTDCIFCCSLVQTSSGGLPPASHRVSTADGESRRPAVPVSNRRRQPSLPNPVRRAGDGGLRRVHSFSESPSNDSRALEPLRGGSHPGSRGAPEWSPTYRLAPVDCGRREIDRVADRGGFGEAEGNAGAARDCGSGGWWWNRYRRDSRSPACVVAVAPSPERAAPGGESGSRRCLLPPRCPAAAGSRRESAVDLPVGQSGNWIASGSGRSSW